MWMLRGRKPGQQYMVIGHFLTYEGAVSSREKALRPTFKKVGSHLVRVPAPWLWTAITEMQDQTTAMIVPKNHTKQRPVRPSQRPRGSTYPMKEGHRPRKRDRLPQRIAAYKPTHGTVMPGSHNLRKR